MNYNPIWQRQFLIRELREKGIKNEALLNAFLRIPREIFVPEPYRSLSYEDCPIPIDWSITTSAPSTIAFMIENLDLKKEFALLEIGTGSGYQTALLAQLVTKVFSIERIKSLGIEARRRILRLGIKNVEFKFGDGSSGWEEKKPFDRIIISAAVETLPSPLIEQMSDGGKIIFPLKRGERQFIYLCLKTGEKIKLRPLREVNFSPLRRGNGA